MAQDLESTFGIDSQTLELDMRATVLTPESTRLSHIGFLTVWEVQSQLATACLILLIVVVPVWCAVAVMILWSLGATVAYHQARIHGLPDLLSSSWHKPPAAGAMWGQWIVGTSFSLVKAWAAGLQPFLFTRAFGSFLLQPGRSWPRHVIRVAIVAVGCTLFGVTAAYHLLGRLGLERQALLRFSLAGPFLNVPYRVVLGALAFNGIGYALGRIPA